MNITQQQLIQKIAQTEALIQNTKATLKSWANQIGKYHKALKEITDQLATIKNQLNLNMNNPNKNTQGGSK